MLIGEGEEGLIAGMDQPRGEDPGPDRRPRPVMGQHDAKPDHPLPGRQHHHRGDAAGPDAQQGVPGRMKEGRAENGKKNRDCHGPCAYRFAPQA